MSVKSWFSVTEVCSNPAALTTQSCLQWCYVEPVCFVELFNILISTLFIQKKFLLTEHWTHKAINSLPSHGSLCRYTDILCRTKDLIFGDSNLLECLSFFLFFSFAYQSVNMWGKTMSYSSAVCEDTNQEDAFASTTTSELFSITNVQCIQHDCLFFLPVCFALVSLSKSRNRVHSLWIPHLVWCLMEIQNTDDGSSQGVQV